MHGPLSSGAGPIVFTEVLRRGATLNLRNDPDSRVLDLWRHFHGGQNTINISVDHLAAGSGNTLTLNTLAGNTVTGNGGLSFNVTGGHGYSLGIGYLSAQGNSLALNPTTASVAVTTLDLGQLTWDQAATLGGSSTGNTIGSIVSSGGNGGDNAYSNAVTVTGGKWAITGASTYTEPTLVTGGELILSGTNSYSGITTVNGGTLLVTNNTALADGTSLTVGAGGVFVFDPSLGTSPVGGSAIAGASISAVPEPGTLVLLLAALGSAVACYRRSKRS